MDGRLLFGNIVYPLDYTYFILYTEIKKEFWFMSGVGIALLINLLILAIFIAIPILIIVLLIKLIQYISEKGRNNE